MAHESDPLVVVASSTEYTSSARSGSPAVEQGMSRSISPAEHRTLAKAAAIDFLICPFTDDEALPAKAPCCCCPEVCCDRTEMPRLLCSAFCGPIQLATSFRHAGRPKEHAAAMCSLAIVSNICASQAVQDYALWVASAKSTAASGALLGSCCVACTASCLSAGLIAQNINQINIEKGGPSSFLKYLVAYFYLPGCTNFQLNRMMDPRNQGWF